MKMITKSKISDKEKKFIRLSFTGHGINDLYFFILPPVLPMILRQYGLSYSAAGGILTAYLATLSIFTYINGKLSDTISRGEIIAGGFLLASSCFCAASFIPWLGLFIPIIALAAVGVSTYHPVMYGMLDEFTTGEKGKMYGGFEFWGIFAIFCMFLLNGTLLSFLEWKYILIITAIPGFFMSFIFFKNRTFLKRPPAGGTEASKQTGEESTVPIGALLLFIITVILRAFGIIAMINFIPTYFIDVFGIKENMAAYTSGLFFLGGLAATQFLGRAGDKKGPLPMLLIVSGLIVPVVFLMSLNLPLWVFPFIVFSLGCLGAGATPLQNMILVTLGRKYGTGQIFGVMMAAITITGAFSPSVLGFVADHVGLQVAFRAFSLPVVAGWILLFILSRVPSIAVVFKRKKVLTS